MLRKEKHYNGFINYFQTTTVSENGNSDENGELEPEHATLSKKFSFFEHFEETNERKVSEKTVVRLSLCPCPFMHKM